MNMFSDIGDMLSGGKLVPQTRLPHGDSLGPVRDETQTLAIQERALSFTGEDFDIYDATSNQLFCRVKGAMLHLPGKDKMRITLDGQNVGELDRKVVAMTPTYDIYRGNGEKIGWIEKTQISLTDTFDVYLEGKGGFGLFKPPPAYRLEGDFIDRQFVMKNEQNEVAAKFTKDGIQFFDQFNHYAVSIAPGMDSVLVVACACAVDEEFDEDHKEKKRRAEEG
jgi:uncharacterized protein YxjI